MTKEILKIIGETSVEFMAKKNNTTKELVMMAIDQGCETAVAQFNKLNIEGLKTVLNAA